MKRTIMFKTTLIKVYILVSGVLIAQSVGITDPSLARDSLQIINKTSPERAIRYAREILSRCDPVEDKKLESQILNTLGEIYLDLNLPSLALSSFIDSKQKSNNKPNAWITLNIGNVYFKQAKWYDAKNQYHNALDLFRRQKSTMTNSIIGRSVALSNLGRIEMNLKHYDDALVYFKEALNVKRSSAQYKNFLRSTSAATLSNPQSGVGVAYQHSLLGQLYVQWGLYDMALEQFDVSDSILENIRNKSKNEKRQQHHNSAERYLGGNFSSRVKIHTMRGEFDKAHAESKFAYALLDDHPFYLIEYFKNLTDLHLAQDSLYVALETLDKGLVVCDINGMPVQELDLLAEKAAILEKNNLERSALDVSKNIIEKKKELSEARMDMLLESLDYKAGFNENRLKLQNAKKRQTALSISAGFAMITLGFLVINYRARKKALDQKAVLIEQENIITQNSLKNKESELIKMSAYIVSKNDLLQSIEKDLEYHTSLIENKSDRKVMEPLKKRIKSKIDDSSDWENFQNQFSVAYPDFVDYLGVNYPKLRSADIKLCCYLKMHMNTKEIARVTGLSVRAVENKRYRLRKKLDLDASESLESFINSFTSLN